MSISSSSKKISSDLNVTNSLPEDAVFKVNHVINGEIDTIYVFYGKNIDSENEEELFKKIFTNAEADNIHTHKIKVVFSEQQIHLDDTIGIIKIKVLNELKMALSIDEIYMYCQKIEILNSISIYQTITQNKKIDLTQLRVEQFLSNIVSEEDGSLFKNPVEKEIYDFDDILQLKLDNKKYIVNKVLGQKFFIVENEYPFVCDPYDVTEYDSFFEKNSRKSLSTLNSHLLLNTGNIFNNNIFLCLAKDVLHYLDRKDVSEDTTIKIYYPFLYNKNVNSLKDLEESSETLMEDTKKLLNKNTLTAFKTIDMFYNIYKYKKTNLNYEGKGIKFIKVVIKPDFDVKIPLEIIFKIVHATENNPLIKYNPASRQENIYRLYADKTSTDGRKIPYMKKANIFKLMRTIAKNKSVAIYIEKTNDNMSEGIICEFDENGFITISSEFQTLVDKNEIDKMFRETINPIIQEIKNLLEQSGYKLNKFNSLSDENVEVRQLTYESNIKITKPLSLEKFKGCISSVFNNESNRSSTGIDLRFKRVSNFNKVTSQEAFILEKSEQGYRGAEIIESLLENFPEDLDRKTAEDLVRKVANEIQVERGVRKSDIKIKDNPGFKTNIKLSQNTGIITITVENINNIYYLKTIPIYLDTIVRLTQDKKSTAYPVKEMNMLCSSAEKEDVIVDDIISTSESSASINEVPSLENGDDEVEYTNYEKMQPGNPKTAYSLFFDEEEIDETDDADAKYESDGGTKKYGSNSDSSMESDDSSSFPKNLNVKTVAMNKKESPENSESESESKSNESLGSFPSIASEEGSIPKNLNVKTVAVNREETKEQSQDDQSVISSKSSNKSLFKEPDQVLTLNANVNQPKTIFIDSENDESDEDEEDSENENIAIEKKPEENIKLTVKPPSVKQHSLIIESSSEDSGSESDEESENNVKNIDGLKLNKPYYFQTLIEEKDPVLIIKEDTPQFNSYSRTCSSDARRQPVILTDSQLSKINKQHPGFLREEDVIKYGSDSKKQYNYICPRYWCLKTNTVIDPNELKEVKGKDGKIELQHPTCGKVLSKKDKKVKPGYYIYEFYGEDKNKRYPGYQVDSHPDGYCLPCCFEKYNTEGRIKAKKKCTINTKDDKSNKPNNLQPPINNKSKKEEGEDERVNNRENEIERENEYIMGPEKYPLNPGRWGYLPVSIQKMLHEVNADCQISKTNTNIKENHPCLLRHGVELSGKQSFLTCISDILFYGKKIIDPSDNKTIKSAKILNAREMCERIINSINIDTYIKYQNGNLVSNFYDSNKKVKIDKYKSSKLFTKIDIEKESDLFYFTKVASSFENFQNFLRDEDALIDHTYLWDIISMPNKHLFPKGVNLVIFQIPNDDITNNVQLLCPTNHYSSEFYEARKPTVIIMKEDGYYEPIYSYMVNNKNYTISKEFKEYDPNLSRSLKAVFKEIVRPFFDTICRPLSSMPNMYKAKHPLLLYELVQKLDNYDYKILKLVMNFNNKIIGVLAEEPKTTRNCFVPCYPSALDENLKKGLDYVFMTDLSLWNTYDNTVIFLNKLYKRSKVRKENADVPCKPAFKIVEDELIVGILTETNQFIQLSEPIAEIDIIEDYDVPSIKNNNYIVNPTKSHMTPIDVPISTSDNVDEERVDYVNRIKLETSFYNVFRNTIRVLINDYENTKLRERIENEITKEYIINSEKLKTVDRLLRELVKDKIQFTGDKNYYKLIKDVSTCVVKDKQSCSDTPNLCVVTKNGKCNIILPKKSLITNKPNQSVYFARMSDELIRYSRIKSFMLKPQTYLSFGNIGYNLRENEIILIQSLLTQEYFETLVPMTNNKYAKLNSYDEAIPLITQPYENVIPSLDDAIGKQIDTKCEIKTNKSILSGAWKKCFPKNYKELEYGETHYCTINIIIDLIERKTSVIKNVNEIKNELYEEYKKYLNEYFDKIVDILIIEGKKTLGDQVKSGKLSFSNFIYTDSYFFTPFDLWLLIVKYEIPAIFISQKFIFQTNYLKNLFVAYGNKNDKFAFIVIPGLRSQIVPKFKLISSNNNDTFIGINELHKECFDDVESDIINAITIENYLESFKKPKTTNYIKKNPQNLIIVNEEENERKKTNKKKHNLVLVDSPEKEEVSPVVNEEPSIIRQEQPVIQKKVPVKKQKNLTKKKQVKLKGQQLTKKVQLIIEGKEE